MRKPTSVYNLDVLSCCKLVNFHYLSLLLVVTTFSKLLEKRLRLFGAEGEVLSPCSPSLLLLLGPSLVKVAPPAFFPPHKVWDCLPSRRLAVTETSSREDGAPRSRRLSPFLNIDDAKFVLIPPGFFHFD